VLVVLELALVVDHPVGVIVGDDHLAELDVGVEIQPGSVAGRASLLDLGVDSMAVLPADDQLACLAGRVTDDADVLGDRDDHLPDAEGGRGRDRLSIRPGQPPEVHHQFPRAELVALGRDVGGDGRGVVPLPHRTVHLDVGGGDRAGRDAENKREHGQGRGHPAIDAGCERGRQQPDAEGEHDHCDLRAATRCDGPGADGCKADRQTERDRDEDADQRHLPEPGPDVLVDRLAGPVVFGERDGQDQVGEHAGAAEETDDDEGRADQRRAQAHVLGEAARDAPQHPVVLGAQQPALRAGHGLLLADVLLSFLWFVVHATRLPVRGPFAYREQLRWTSG
jgi:hypothetical protein